MDAHKTELARGLSELGLSVVTAVHFDALQVSEQHDYSWALLQYYAQLEARAKLLKVEGSQLDGGILHKLYGGHNLDWAGSYAQELEGLQDVMRHTPILDRVQQLRKERAVRVLFNKTVPGYRAVVEYDQQADEVKVARQLTRQSVSYRRKAA